MEIRQIASKDYLPIINVLNDWWNGRNMTDMLPKLFFDHFQNTSFVIEDEGQINAFLVGFKSQSVPNEAYIHFVGVDPSIRKGGLGRQLYDHFFEVLKEQDCQVVRCITSPINKTSIAFHQSMGFEIEPSEKVLDGVFVHPNYDGNGNDRVLFKKML